MESIFDKNFKLPLTAYFGDNTLTDVNETPVFTFTMTAAELVMTAMYVERFAYEPNFAYGTVMSELSEYTSPDVIAILGDGSMVTVGTPCVWAYLHEDCGLSEEDANRGATEVGEYIADYLNKTFGCLQNGGADKIKTTKNHK